MAPVTLFDVFIRSDMERASRLEPEFSWWNRSAWPEVEVVRRELESWFARLPPNEATALARRFRSKDDDLHRGALFEVYVHEHLSRAGFSVDLHPRIPGRTRSPDFLALHPSGSRVYVEAVAAGPSVAQQRAERLKDAAIEAIDSLQSSLFFVSVRVSGEASGPLPIRRTRLREQVVAWLVALDRPSMMRSRRQDPLSPRPTFHWEAAGLRLELAASIKGPAEDGKGVDRLLAAETGRAIFQAPGNPAVEGALRKKAGRYGSLGAPYFVAINVLDSTVGAENIVEALENVWGTPKNPKYSRVTGVILANVCNPLAATRNRLKTVLNPSATHGPPAGFNFPELEGSLV